MRKRKKGIARAASGNAAGKGSAGVRMFVTLAVAAVVLFPFAALALWSVSRGWYYPQIVPQQLDFSAWGQVFADGSRLLRGTINSLMIAAAVTAVSVLVAVPAGRAIALRYRRYGGVIGGILLFTSILPPVVFGVGITFFFNMLGLSGTIPGVMLAHMLPSLSFCTLVATGLFAGYDTDPEDAARTLGASPARVLFRITIPALRSGIAVIALFGFLISWSQYALSLQIGGGIVETLPLLVFAYITGGNPQYGSVAGLIMVLPTLIVLGAAYRTLGRGLGANW